MRLNPAWLRGIEVARRKIAKLAATLERYRASAGMPLVTLRPDPSTRDDGGTNAAVLLRLAKKHPRLLAPDAVMLRAIGDDCRAAARAGTPIANLPSVAALAAMRVVAERLRSGQYVTNTAETTARKRARGQSLTPGLATEQLADSLDAAHVATENL